MSIHPASIVAVIIVLRPTLAQLEPSITLAEGVVPPLRGPAILQLRASFMFSRGLVMAPAPIPDEALPNIFVS